MKQFISILIFAAWGTVSFAQDTAYISRDKVTALFFTGPVKIVGNTSSCFAATQIESGIIALKAIKPNFNPVTIDIKEENTGKIHQIQVSYSYGRAGRRIDIQSTRPFLAAVKPPQFNDAFIANKIASGKRKDVVDHQKAGGVKAWINRLSLAGNKIYFRLDIRNRSNLPYDIDFVRFYIRDLKTVARMATHEQEIVPAYSTLNKTATISSTKEVAKVFAFHRFSLSEDQALNVELYERNGNRHLYLRIRQKDLEDLQIINPARQQPESTLAANTNN